jgi:pSer/pThr/pTyr-binding forkhead associated (FHA) protein
VLAPAPQGGGQGGAALIVQDGPLAGRRFPVGTELVIGREHADVCLEDPQVSRRHAAVRPMERGIEVEDLGSANGTLVNGDPLTGRLRLRDGDVIQVGRMRLTASVPEPRRQETVLPGIRRDALLVVRDGAMEGQRFPVAGEVVIGREHADVTLDDGQVSRRHAIVRPVPGGVEIEDLHSANGTRVNGELIDGGVRLASGDLITIGRVTMEAQIGSGMTGGAARTLVGSVNGNGAH